MTNEMLVVKKRDGTTGEPRWKFQYGRWDLRVDCPKCGCSEVFQADAYEKLLAEGTTREGGRFGHKEAYEFDLMKFGRGENHGPEEA